MKTHVACVGEAGCAIVQAVIMAYEAGIAQ